MKKQLIPIVFVAVMALDTTSTFALSLTDIDREISFFRTEQQVLGASATMESGVLVTTEQKNASSFLSQEKRALILKDLRDSQAGKPVITKAVKYGQTKSDEVKKLQIFLIAKGYLKAEPTGKFFVQTKAALKQYQTDNNIPGGDGTLSGLKTNQLINATTTVE